MKIQTRLATLDGRASWTEREVDTIEDAIVAEANLHTADDLAVEFRSPIAPEHLHLAKVSRRTSYKIEWES